MTGCFMLRAPSNVINEHKKIFLGVSCLFRSLVDTRALDMAMGIMGDQRIFTLESAL